MCLVPNFSGLGVAVCELGSRSGVQRYFAVIDGSHVSTLVSPKTIIRLLVMRGLGRFAGGVVCRVSHGYDCAALGGHVDSFGGDTVCDGLRVWRETLAVHACARSLVLDAGVGVAHHRALQRNDDA